VTRIDLGIPGYHSLAAEYVREEFITLVIAAAFQASAGHRLPQERVEITEKGVSLLVDDESAGRYKELAEQFMTTVASPLFWKGVITALIVLDSNPIITQPLKNPKRVARCD
jgi:hypothetical protein